MKPSFQQVRILFLRMLVSVGWAGVAIGCASQTRSVAPAPATQSPGIKTPEVICMGPFLPALILELRDPWSRPAAIGTKLIVNGKERREPFRSNISVDSDLRLGVGLGPGPYEVKIVRAGYVPVTLRGTTPPTGDRCHAGMPPETRSVQLHLAPYAAAIRQVVVLPGFVSLGIPEESWTMRAYVDATPGQSTTVTWSSADPGIVSVSESGIATAHCWPRRADVRVFATSTVAARVRGFGIVEILPIDDSRGLSPPEARAAVDACNKKFAR